jgi:hypothetical protein
MKACFVCALVSAGNVLVGAPAGFAQVAGDLSIQVGECVELTLPQERYACFERQVDAALTKTDALDVHSTRSAAPTSSARQPPSAVGAVDPSGRVQKTEQTEQLVSTVAALHEVLPNQYLITLENGQTWRQMTSERYPLRIGHHVRVYSTRWGDSHRLTAEESKGYIQVERVR